MAEVQHLFVCLVHRFPMNELTEAEALENKGFKGCIHGRPDSKRQVLLMDRETLDKFELAPGVVKENVTVVGLDFQKLGIGQRLKIGESLLELTTPCDPCPRMDEIRMGLQEELRGQRGWLCRVVEAGTIRKGDAVTVRATVAAEAK
ncbi:MAG TPA: MOSC domain-containing protein [Candidatus Acidoferrales bacterium]